MRWIANSLIRLYQMTFSSLVGNCCRFQPTCSEYAKQSYQKHGVIKGTVLTVWRLMRCHPWAKGGYDPVPEKGQALFFK